MKCRIILLCVFFWIGSTAYAQSKKQIKSNKVKSATEYTTETLNGKEVTYKSAYLAYDKDGNTVEKTEYLPNGDVKKRNTAKFDSKGNKIEETDFIVKEEKKAEDKPGTTKNTKTVSKYNSNNDKTEEVVYDLAANKQLKKIQMSYNSNGDKTIEVEFDADNKLVKKIVYNYDKKGLRVERKTYDGNNVLIEGKKFVFEF